MQALCYVCENGTVGMTLNLQKEGERINTVFYHSKNLVKYSNPAGDD